MSLIEISTDGAVRTVTLARPEKRNALNAGMMDALREAFEVTPPKDERVTVIRAQGAAFCSGLELSTDGIDKSETVRIEKMFDAVYRYPLPTVAIVQGAAIAGGCELALHCDFAVAARDAVIAMPLAQFGVATTWFLTKKIMDAAGPVVAREFLLLGDPLPPERLQALGIIARVANRDGLDAAAQTIIERLAANAPMSMKTMKEIMIRQTDHTFSLPHEDIDEAARNVYASRDAIEGVAARHQKRQAIFRGE
jgi:enoyl-CoA hydratase/carnithine racemase